MTRTRPALDLFVVSGLILFLELAFIRWMPAHVLFLTFFTNAVLLACFVGMSVGCLIARSPTRYLRRTPLLIAVALAVGMWFNLARSSLERHVDVASQGQGDVVFFGTEASYFSQPSFVVPVEVVVAGMFLLIAAALVGPGQELGRAFNRIPSRASAYAVNLAGSLVGIVLFAACSWLHLPPLVWFAGVALGLLYLLLRPDPDAPTPRPSLTVPVFCLLATLLLTAKTSGVVPLPGDTTDHHWSPYYRVDHDRENQFINTNLISHQVMIPRSDPLVVAYHLPHLFQRAVGRPPFERILVIGAGSGNDVSRALLWAAPDARIDAVDIEPVIQQIGRDHHPDRPYDDPRVTTHLDDGRNFLRRAPAGEYDLVIYALVDSLVMHSGYGNIRLESFLFTDQAFADIRRVLRPKGTFAVYNYFRQGWIVSRLREALCSTFGADPVALTDPPTDTVAMNDFASVFTLFLAGSEETVGPVRAAFASGANQFWVPGNRPVTPETPCRFGSEPPPTDDGTEWIALRTATIEDSGGALRPATDEWPFLYTRQPTIPGYVLRGMGLMVLLSVALWYLYRPRRSESAPVVAALDSGLLLRAFLLGAGFMLIETKAIVQMALLFGSTWAVNTVVFAAILLMALAGNLYAALVNPRNLTPYYIGLLAALGANLLVPLDAFLGLDRATQIALSCGLVFAPVAFAGVVFPVSFARAPRPDRFFGANVAGALAGGLAENMSMLVGFRYLLVVAVVIYAASALFGRPGPPTHAADWAV